MATIATRKKRRTRLSRMLFIFVFTTVVMATDVLGTVPNNSLSAEIRQVFSAALPTEFTGDLNLELEKYELPTLPPPLQQAPGNVNIFTVPEGSQENLDVLAKLDDTFAPNPTVTIASVPTSTPPTATVIPPTSVPTIVPGPTAFIAKESKLDMARTWTLYDAQGEQIDKTFTIEKQGDAYVVTEVTSPLGFVELIDQSWDGEKLTWKYNVDQGDGNTTVFTLETTGFNVCGCGGLGYLLDIYITTGPDGFNGGTEPVYQVGMPGNTELVPNADYSGNWKSVSHDDAGNAIFDYFTIEKQGNGYVVTSVSSNEEGPAPIVSQSWDGEVLEWQYQRYGTETVTMRTVGMDKAGILVVSKYGSWWGDNQFVDTGSFLEP